VFLCFNRCISILPMVLARPSRPLPLGRRSDQHHGRPTAILLDVVYPRIVRVCVVYFENSALPHPFRIICFFPVPHF
jgi:hypothetical protein